MKVTGRITALFLSIVMILSMLPAMVFAEDDNAAAEPLAADPLTTEEAAVEVQPADPEEAVVEESGESAEEASVEEAATEEAATEEAAVEEAAVEEEKEAEDPDEYADDGEEYDESEIGSCELSYSEGLDADELVGVDPESQMEQFFFGEDKGESVAKRAPLSIKGERLTGNNLKYYNYYRTIIQNVSARKTENAYMTVKVESFLGKRKFTASQLGVSKIGYVKNGKLIFYAAAEKKIKALFQPQDINKVFACINSDLTNKGYWVNWYGEKSFSNMKFSCTGNAKSITFSANSRVQFTVPVMPEFAKKGSGSSVYTYKADLNKLKSAEAAKANAKTIIGWVNNQLNTEYAGRTADELKKIKESGEYDARRLYLYGDVIARITEYDHEAAEDKDCKRTSPWSMISVLDEIDGSNKTKAVCAGYARAYKYLCDISKFYSDWIDCQIVSGTSGTPDSSHMWNIVRMNDGLNYVVDPTWMDDGDTANKTWCLRGDPNGTANYFTISGNYRTYDSHTKLAFAAAERKLSTRSEFLPGLKRAIKLTKPTILAPVRAKKAFKVRWKKVTKPIAALYVDGYQIRYCVRANMKGAKKVTVKGCNRASRAIKKLRSRKYYYVQVRTYAKLGGKYYYSPWSVRKKVKTK